MTSQIETRKIKWRFTRKRYLLFGRAFYIIGNIPELGAWDLSRALRLKWATAHNWYIEVEIPVDVEIEYKFVEGAWSSVHDNIVWEGGENRKLRLPRDIAVGNTFSIMSYNLRYDEPADGECRWEHRKKQAVKMILQKFPCVIGIQQAQPGQRAYLYEHLKQYYGYIGIPRDLEQDEEVGIFYLAHKFFVIDFGYVWFNEKREAGKLGFGAKYPRNLTYIIVDDQQTNEVSLIINTHFDNKSQESRKNSVSILLNTIDGLFKQNTRFREKPIKNIYISGDFNTEDYDPIFQELYNSQYKFQSVRNTARETDKSTTFHWFKGDKYQDHHAIDHIFYSSEHEPLKFYLVKSGHPYLSDHHPVVAQFANE